MYAARKNFEFCNMLLAALYALRKNLEKAHIRQICATKTIQKSPKGTKFWQTFNSLPFEFCHVGFARGCKKASNENC